MVNNNPVNIITGGKNMVHCKKKTGPGDSSKTTVLAIEESPECVIKQPNNYSSLEKKHVKQNTSNNK